jgi:hypothetical protein
VGCAVRLPGSVTVKRGAAPPRCRFVLHPREVGGRAGAGKESIVLNGMFTLLSDDSAMVACHD